MTLGEVEYEGELDPSSVGTSDTVGVSLRCNEGKEDPEGEELGIQVGSREDDGCALFFGCKLGLALGIPMSVLL